MPLNRPLAFITHSDNLGPILRGGRLPSDEQGGVPTQIWSDEFVASRAACTLPLAPARSLAAFVALHPSVRSPAVYNLATGRNVPRVPNSALVHLMTSTRLLLDWLVPVVVVDRQPLARGARFEAGPAGLSAIDWPLLASGVFSSDPSDPGRTARAGAEVLAFGGVPVGAISEIVCWSGAAAISAMVSEAGLAIPVIERRGAFFAKGA